MNPLETNQNTGATTSVVGTNVPSTLDFASVNNPTPLETPVPTLPTNLLAGLATTATTQANTDTGAADSASSTYSNLLNQLAGQTPDTQALENQAGIPTQQKELLDLQQVANKQTADYTAGIIGAEAARNTRQETNVAQTNLTRQHGIDALLTNSLISAKQGNITYAQSLVDRAIAAKYDPIKATINAQKFILDQATSKAAESRKTALDLKLKQIDKQEANDKEVQNMIMSAAEFAPADILSKATAKAAAGGTPTEVALQLGQYGTNYLKNLAYKSQLETDKAQRANIYSQIAERNAKALEDKALANFVTPPTVNPQTGKADPSNQLSSVISALKGKTDDKLKLTASVIAATQAFAERNANGKFSGLGPVDFTRLPFGSTKASHANLSDLALLELNVQSWATGASVAQDQMEKIRDTLIPKTTDRDAVIQNKLNALTNYMQNYAKGNLATQGIKYDPGEVDLFGGISAVSNDALLNSIPPVSQDTTALVNNKSFFDR